MAMRDLLNQTTRSVVTAPADLTVEDAIVLMDQEKVGALIVVKEDRPVGIFSTRECLRLCLEKKPALFGGITLDAAMSKPITVGPDEARDTVMDMMLRADIDHLPVIEDSRLKGVLNVRDLMMERIQILEDELRHLKNYIDDLHEAGRD